MRVRSIGAGLIVIAGNWVWSIFSGISDAKAAGGSGGPGGNTASIVRPQLVPLDFPHAVGDPGGEPGRAPTLSRMFRGMTVARSFPWLRVFFEGMVILGSIPR